MTTPTKRSAKARVKLDQDALNDQPWRFGPSHSEWLPKYVIRSASGQAQFYAATQIEAASIAEMALRLAEIQTLTVLLQEAADSVLASQAEDGISDDRRKYRVGLEKRLRSSLKILTPAKKTKAL